MPPFVLRSPGASVEIGRFFLEFVSFELERPAGFECRFLFIVKLLLQASNFGLVLVARRCLLIVCTSLLAQRRGDFIELTSNIRFKSSRMVAAGLQCVLRALPQFAQCFR